MTSRNSSLCLRLRFVAIVLKWKTHNNCVNSQSGLLLFSKKNKDDPNIVEHFLTFILEKFSQKSTDKLLTRNNNQWPMTPITWPFLSLTYWITSLELVKTENINLTQVTIAKTIVANGGNSGCNHLCGFKVASSMIKARNKQLFDGHANQRNQERKRFDVSRPEFNHIMIQCTKWRKR